MNTCTSTCIWLYFYLLVPRRGKKINFESQLGIDALIFGNFPEFLIYCGLAWGPPFLPGFAQESRAQELNAPVARVLCAPETWLGVFTAYGEVLSRTS